MQVAYEVITAGMLFVLAIWIFIFAFFLGVFLPFAVALKLLFNRDILKILKDGFRDPFDNVPSINFN